MGIGKLSPREKYFHFSTNSFEEILSGKFVGGYWSFKIFFPQKKYGLSPTTLRNSIICMYPFRKGLSVEGEEGLLS